MSRQVRTVVFALGVLVCGAFYAWMSLNPELQISNQSGKRLMDVKCVLSTGENRWTEDLGNLETGQSARISRATPDLFLWSIEYQWGGTSVIWKNAGLATTGESLELLVGPDGTISTRYR